MLANILIDFVVGLVPWIGDILDVFYKSNQYNLTILTVSHLFPLSPSYQPQALEEPTVTLCCPNGWGTLTNYFVLQLELAFR